MGQDLKLVLVSNATMVKYGETSKLNTVWNTSYFYEEIQGKDLRQAVENAHDCIKNIWDEDDFASDWPSFETMIRDGDLPLNAFENGQWGRLEYYFKQHDEWNLFKKALYGSTSPKFPIEATYGNCKLVSPDLAGKIADALERVNLAKLPGESAKKMPPVEVSDDFKEKIVSDIRSRLGISKDMADIFGNISIHLSPESQAVMESMDKEGDDCVPDEYDQAALAELTKFYRQAQESKGTVICGIC